MRKRAFSLLAAGITLLVVGGIVACNSHGPRIDADAAEIPSATVAAAAQGNIAHTLSLAGQFQPYQVVDVHPKVTGFMVKINVDIGDKVHKGQILAVLGSAGVECSAEGHRIRDGAGSRTTCSARSTRSSAQRPRMRRFTPTTSVCWKRRKRSPAWLRNRNWTTRRARICLRSPRSMRPRLLRLRRKNTPRWRTRITTASRHCRTTPMSWRHSMVSWSGAMPILAR